MKSLQSLRTLLQKLPARLEALTPDSVEVKPTGSWSVKEELGHLAACDTTNVCTTVYGTDLTFNITDLNHTSTTGNQNSATIQFTPYCTTGQNPVCQANWKSITFKACSDPSGTLQGACYPAFEFDNLQFKLSSNATGGPISAPTPELSSMLLLGSGIGSIGILLRRRLRR